MADFMGALEAARKDAHKKTSQIDNWLEGRSEKKSELFDALAWYAENRTHRFGWRAFYEALRSQDGWDDLPENYKCLEPWAKDNLPELF